MKIRILHAGMPMGSPGMGGPRKDAFDVMLVRGNGHHTNTIYRHHNGNQL